MKNKLFKTSLTLMGSLILGTVLLSTNTALATATENTINTSSSQTDTNFLSDIDIKQIDKFINFDEFNAEFTLDLAVQNIIGVQKLNEVQNIINETNKQISSAKNDKKAGTIWAETPDGTEITITSTQTRAYGKNDIKFYWNYARIWINAGTLRNAVKVGFAIGSVYAPAKIIQAACAIAGISNLKNIKNGIWMDYNYIGQVINRVGIQ